MARRKTEVFSMSFLDCITCAFGSVVLVYVLINAKGGLRAATENRSLQAEVQQLEEQVLEGYQNLVMLKNSMVQTEQEAVRTEGLGERVLAETEQLKQQLADADKETLSRREAIERLKADLKSLEEGTRRLEGASERSDTTGTRVRGFTGDGDRQYLTGLRVGGGHILIMVDASASMLDESDRLAPLVVPTRRGAEQLRRILETLARVELTDGLHLPQLIEETASRMPRAATVMVILPQVTEEAAIALANLKRRGFAVEAVLNLYDEYDFAQASGPLLAAGIPTRHLKDETGISTLCRNYVLR